MIGEKIKRVVWKTGRVISIETRCRDENRAENVYVLAQMLDEARLLVFNLFNTDNQWENVDLSKAPILFCAYVTRQFIANSNVYVQKIAPLKDYQPPEYHIQMDAVGVRKISLWKGTPHEREVLMMGSGGGWLVKGTVQKETVSGIAFTDDETIDRYELTNVRIYAEFNERLYLCYKMGKNVDPMKDLVFNRPIPLEYEEYMKIISS